MKCNTIKELKELIKNLPDDMRIGGSDHHGKFLECYYARVKEIDKTLWSGKKEEIFCIDIQSAGDEPD